MSRAWIILVNWNGWRDTLECLESLLLLDYPDFRIVICDNGSDDGSLERIAGWVGERGVTLARFQREGGSAVLCGDPLITLIDIGENLGFAGGNNVGIRHALARGAAYCWLLNNDTVVEPDALSQLVARMRQDASVGICGSTLRLYHDRDRIQALGGGFYYRWLGVPWHYGRCTRWNRSAGLQLRAEARMNYVEGASMLVSRDFLERVGLLNEEYFLYFEEADWALRGRGRFALGYAAGSVVYHKVGGSIGTSSNPSRKSYVCDFYNVRNRILFARRHHPFTLPTVYLVLMVEVLLRVLCGRWDRAGMILGLMFGGAKCAGARP